MAPGTTEVKDILLANVFCFSSFVQFQRAINAIDPLVVPTVAQPTQTSEQLTESLALVVAVPKLLVSL